MNCLFCSNKFAETNTVYPDIGILGISWGGDCINCKARFYFNEDDIVVIWAFDFTYKNKELVCIWNKSNDTTKIRPLNDFVNVITTLHGQMPLTPNNILQKMPTIMVFS